MKGAVPLRHRLIAAGLGAIEATGAHRWLSPLARGRGVILMFHRVVPDAASDFAPNRFLEVTPGFLDVTLQVLRREGFEVIPMDAVPGRLKGPKSAPFAAITFDDGYRDNIVHARPVLKAHGAPWTVYVTDAFASGTGRLWWLDLEAAVERLDRVEYAHGEARLTCLTRSPAEKRAAFDLIHRHLRRLEGAPLREALDPILAEAGIDPQATTRRLCADWDEIRALSRDPDVTIGAHTVTHPRLALLGQAEALAEIAKGRAACENRLGLPVRHLAYPFGDVTAAGPREFGLAQAAGFATAVTTRPGHVRRGHAAHPHAMPRVSVNGLHQNAAALRGLLSGVPFLPARLPPPPTPTTLPLRRKSAA